MYWPRGPDHHQDHARLPCWMEAAVSCSDPECPACKLRVIIQSMADLGLTAEDVMPMVCEVLGEVYPDVEIVEVSGSTLH